MKIYLVKPHPPDAIMNRHTPISEEYRYNWEPMSLKLIAYALMSTHPDVDVKLWHLMSPHDDSVFIESARNEKPDIIAFSEIDILVNEVSRLAMHIKGTLQDTVTIVGGKQTSVLHEGDVFPFRGIDHAFRGDGATVLLRIVEGHAPESIDGYVHRTHEENVIAPVTFSRRYSLEHFNGISMRSIPVEGHSIDEYLGEHNVTAGLHGRSIKTAPLLTGMGCVFSCSFCQSPIEYGANDRKKINRDPAETAREMKWLMEEHGAEGFFSLEPNLDLRNLLDVYHELEANGIQTAPMNGFIRPYDVVQSYLSGFLGELTQRGLRMLSIGLDLSLVDGVDLYNKSYGWNDLLRCLEICKHQGILVYATWLGDLTCNARMFKSHLDSLLELPVAWVDVRLPIAIRNTSFFQTVEPQLIHPPVSNTKYFDQQNYRYQTIRYKNGITPDETYALVQAFYEIMLKERPHSVYAKTMKHSHPDTAPFFENYYDVSRYHALVSRDMDREIWTARK